MHLFPLMLARDEDYLISDNGRSDLLGSARRRKIATTLSETAAGAVETCLK